MMVYFLKAAIISAVLYALYALMETLSDEEKKTIYTMLDAFHWQEKTKGRPIERPA